MLPFNYPRSIKMKKISVWILSAVFAFALCGCSFFSNDYADVLKANWGFTLPKGAGYKEVYEKSESAFNGDGFRYYVFTCEENEPILEAFSWTDTQQSTLFFDSYQEACEEWLDKLDVPKEERPEYSECVFWYQSHQDYSEIVLLFHEAQGKLYTVECFM